MNIWDSVQRGLEKASNEAGRIARIQRLRAIIDQLTNQQQVQRNLLADKTLELFNAGQITQGDLLLICQELTRLQQQLLHVQQELKLVQGQGPAIAPTPGLTGGSGIAGSVAPTYPPYPGGTTLIPPPPPETGQAFIPPPPPSEEEHSPVTASNFMTVQADLPVSSGSAIRSCPACQAEVLPGYAFCHNCGTPITINDTQATRRSDGTPGEEEHTHLRPEGGA